MKWSVKVFKTNLQKVAPVTQFIYSQDKYTKAKFTRLVELVEKYGPFIRPPYSKKIASNLFELRIKGKMNTRIFYTWYDGDCLLLHAFHKKTQKTPNKELKIAVARLAQLL